MRQRPAPMTKDQAIAIVAEMMAKTSKRARISMWTHAIGPIGNLSDEAKEIYRAALRKDGAL